jgi:site-specific recombinase XerD
MVESVFRSVRVQLRLQQSLLGLPIFDAVTTYLVDRRHPVGTVQQYVQSIEHFDRWLRRTRRPISEIGEEVVARFLSEHLPRCRCPAPACTTLYQVRAALRHLLVVLRSQGCIAPARRPAETSASARLIQEFTEYLHDVRGVAPTTCMYYQRYAREFLAVHFANGPVDVNRIQPAAITQFITDRSARWVTGSMQAATNGLRSFFRFLLVTGRGNERLVRAVPRIPNWKLSSIPRVLTDDQVRAVLDSFDRSTATGLRGFAMITCLAALGLRACEVAALTIDDFDWRAGTITVPATKTRRADVLPLPAPVARAVVAYLRRGRPRTTTRRVFVRHVAPVGEAAGPSIVRQTVWMAAVRAGLDRKLSCASVFRHTVATRLLRTGATIKEVADVLRHRSIDTVAIYAKVDLTTLRTVALPWPGGTP